MSDYIMGLGIFLSGGDTLKYAHRYKIRDSVTLVPYKSFDRSWLQIRHNGNNDEMMFSHMMTGLG